MRLLPKSKTTLLTEEIDFLRAQVAQLQNYVLMTGGAPTGFPTWSPPHPGSNGSSSGDAVGDEPSLRPADAYRTEAQRMYTTEEEEDVHFALEEGLIDQAEANRRLKEIADVAQDIDLM